MIARLILVGVVGVLGISLPDEAGWAARSSWAPREAVASVGPRAAVSFEPIVVDDNPMDRIADELNRASEIVDIPVTPVARVATMAPPVPSVSDQAVDRLFAENRVWSEPAAATDVAIVAEPRPDIERIAVVGDASSVVDELNRASEVVDVEPTTAAVRTSRSPSFEPIAVTDGASGIADELNRRSDGLSAPQGIEQPEVEHALGLTRRAALAWLNVLTDTMNAPSSTR